ncbi:MAG: hypothetical protein ACT4N2_03655 [Hyphomicrobium sp.]
MSKFRALAVGLITGAAAFTPAAPAVSSPLARATASIEDAPAFVEVHAKGHRGKHRYYRATGRDDVVVHAPTTFVETRGRRVWVDAPFTSVRVGHRSVWVRAPFVNLYVRR